MNCPMLLPWCGVYLPDKYQLGLFCIVVALEKCVVRWARLEVLTRGRRLVADGADGTPILTCSLSASEVVQRERRLP